MFGAGLRRCTRLLPEARSLLGGRADKSTFIEDEHTKKKYWEQDFTSKLFASAYGPDDDSYFQIYQSMAGLGKMESPEEVSKLSHVDHEGKARMVDVSHKLVTQRSAEAVASVHLGAEAFAQVAASAVRKGDVLTVSQLAGIMGAKKTSELIPLCHPVKITSVNLSLRLNEERHSVDIVCEARARGQTGVEMEALTGAAVAALTVYDMCKAVAAGMHIADIRLIKKTGGKSEYIAAAPAS